MYFFYYLPVGVDTDARRFPIMTMAFAAISTVVFVLLRYFPDATSLNFYNFIYYPGYSGWEAALAAAFLHFGYVHIIGNLVYMILFGTYLEGRLGPIGYSLLFLGSAIVGNYVQGLYNIHVLHVDIGIIGASGAVSGILGGFLVRLYQSRVRIAYWVFAPLLAYTRAGRVDVPIIFAIALWVLLQSVRSLMQFEGASANVAHVTHLAGFIFGVVFTICVGGLRHGREEAHHIRARRYLRKGDPLGAQDELSRYVALRPEDGHAHAELARVLVMTGDDLGAKANYLKACELLLMEGRRDLAEATYAQALRGYKEFVLSPEPHLDLAFGLERNLKYETALTAYVNFANWHPRHSEAAFALLRAANIHRNSFARPDSARLCYQRLIEQYPQDTWVDFAREQVRLLV